MKYLDIKQRKYVQDPNQQSYITMQCSWIEWLHIFKMSVLYNLFYGFNTISSKITKSPEPEAHSCNPR
jgi:hypothetical protein